MGFEHQSTNRADGNALTAILAAGLTHRFIPKSGDHSAEAAISKTDGSPVQFFLADPDASAAEHAFVRVIDE